MKKILSVVLALVLLLALAAPAFAATGTAEYKNGKVYWSATGVNGDLTVRLNGTKLGGNEKGEKTVDLAPGTYTLEFVDFGGVSTTTFTVGTPATATPAPTDTPAPTATPTVEPTATPTVEPTKAPTQAPTTAPTQRPTTRPTKTPSSDVPKTGDSANAVYVMGGLRLLAGACLVLSRKVSK